MARINLAFIQGYVEEDPIIIKDDNQNIKRVMLNLQLSRGFREVGDGRTENRYDVIQLATEEEFNTKIMADLKKGDIIRVKGVYTTTLGEKVYTCKNCGRKTRKISMITFVTPIKIDIVSRNNSPNDAFKYMKLLAKTEGIFVGVSSGAVLNIGIKEALKNENKNIVLIFPDLGERYLSIL